jgi:hypothetical protein
VAISAPAARGGRHAIFEADLTEITSRPASIKATTASGVDKGNERRPRGVDKGNVDKRNAGSDRFVVE